MNILARIFKFVCVVKWYFCHFRHVVTTSDGLLTHTIWTLGVMDHNPGRFSTCPNTMPGQHCGTIRTRGRARRLLKCVGGAPTAPGAAATHHWAGPKLPGAACRAPGAPNGPNLASRAHADAPARAGRAPAAAAAAARAEEAATAVGGGGGEGSGDEDRLPRPLLRRPGRRQRPERARGRCRRRAPGARRQRQRWRRRGWRRRRTRRRRWRWWRW